jgi:hypothetical protein
MKKPLRPLVGVLLAAGTLIQSPIAVAQVPPHQPGTICFTSSFWCWASPPGPPGGQCYCPSPYGPVQGVLG